MSTWVFTFVLYSLNPILTNVQLHSLTLGYFPKGIDNIPIRDIEANRIIIASEEQYQLLNKTGTLTPI